jgi:hypothetical protein
MSNITLYTTDENTATGIREASFPGVLDAARLALARHRRPIYSKFRIPTLKTSPLGAAAPSWRFALSLSWSRSYLAQPARRRYKRFEEVIRLTSDKQSIGCKRQMNPVTAFRSNVGLSK